jgi:hypothetical protein
VAHTAPKKIHHEGHEGHEEKEQHKIVVDSDDWNASEPLRVLRSFVVNQLG